MSESIMGRLYTFLILCLLVHGCTESEQLTCSPARVGAAVSQNIIGYDQQLRAIENELAKTAESPDDFFVSLNENERSHIAYLWHESSFEPENCNRIGSSSGLNRTYIIENGKVIQELRWL